MLTVRNMQFKLKATGSSFLLHSSWLHRQQGCPASCWKWCGFTLPGPPWATLWAQKVDSSRTVLLLVFLFLLQKVSIKKMICSRGQFAFLLEYIPMHSEINKAWVTNLNNRCFLKRVNREIWKTIFNVFYGDMVLDLCLLFTSIPSMNLQQN